MRFTLFLYFCFSGVSKKNIERLLDFLWEKGQTRRYFKLFNSWHRKVEFSYSYYHRFKLSDCEDLIDLEELSKSKNLPVRVRCPHDLLYSISRKNFFLENRSDLVKCNHFLQMVHLVTIVETILDFGSSEELAGFVYANRRVFSYRKAIQIILNRIKFREIEPTYLIAIFTKLNLNVEDARSYYHLAIKIGFSREYYSFVVRLGSHYLEKVNLSSMKCTNEKHTLILTWFQIAERHVLFETFLQSPNRLPFFLEHRKKLVLGSSTLNAAHFHSMMDILLLHGNPSEVADFMYNARRVYGFRQSMQLVMNFLRKSILPISLFEAVFDKFGVDDDLISHYINTSMKLTASNRNYSYLGELILFWKKRRMGRVPVIYELLSGLVDSNPDEEVIRESFAAFFDNCTFVEVEKLLFIVARLIDTGDITGDMFNEEISRLTNHAIDLYLERGDLKTAVLFAQSAQLQPTEEMKARVTNRIKLIQSSVIKPSLFAGYDYKKDRMKIAILMAMWGRHTLTRKVLGYYRKVKERIAEVIDLDIVVVGSEGEISRGICEESQAIYIESDNFPVSFKWQKAMDKAKEIDVDAVVILGSDDLLPVEVFFDYYLKIREGYLYVGIRDLAILSNGESIHWKGYSFSNQPKRMFEAIGAGKLITKPLLKLIDYNAWGAEERSKGLDGLMTDQFVASGMYCCHPSTVIKHECSGRSYYLGLPSWVGQDLGGVLVDLKLGGENLTSLSRFTSQPSNNWDSILDPVEYLQRNFGQDVLDEFQSMF